VSFGRVRRVLSRLRSSGVTPETEAQLRVIEQAILDAPIAVRRASPPRVTRIVTPEQMDEILYSLLGEVIVSQLVSIVRDERDRRNRV